MTSSLLKGHPLEEHSHFGDNLLSQDTREKSMKGSMDRANALGLYKQTKANALSIWGQCGVATRRAAVESRDGEQSPGLCCF